LSKANSLLLGDSHYIRKAEAEKILFRFGLMEKDSGLSPFKGITKKQIK